MTTINDISDLVRILRENQDWAQSVRSILLTDELLSLPEKFNDFVEITRETNRLVSQRLKQLEDGQKRLEQGQKTLQEGQKALENRMDRLEGRFGNLEGSDYERRTTQRTMGQAIALLGMTSPKIAHSPAGHSEPSLSSNVSEALRSKAIDPGQVEDLYRADIIITSQDGHCAVIEASLTPDLDDINRAKTRAAILAAATGDHATPVVACHDPTQEFINAAEQQDVTVFPIAR